ncbi:MAG: hypothetical protein RIS94_1321 [Pseudomonadota bacterium]|jgi:predicted ester cyclase
MIGNLPLPARLLRGFATDFLTSHDRAEAERIMAPAYRLSIGGHLFDGRDGSYLPATLAQLEQFPGLCVTVHDVVLGENGIAMRFTEHGVSTRNPGCAAAWGGITLFTLSDGRLVHGWAEEDYFARKRQLKSGRCDAIAAPHPAPWDQPVRPADPAAERALARWLQQPSVLGDTTVVEPILADGPGLTALIAPQAVRIDAILSAGNRVAFHAECSGTYAGGFPDIDPAQNGADIVLRIAAIADVQDGRVRRVQISADRLGLHRFLLDIAKEK